MITYIIVALTERKGERESVCVCVCIVCTERVVEKGKEADRNRVEGGKRET